MIEHKIDFRVWEQIKFLFPNTPKLYDSVPTDPSRARISQALKDAVLVEISFAQLNGTITLKESWRIRKKYLNPTLTSEIVDTSDTIIFYELEDFIPQLKSAQAALT